MARWCPGDRLLVYYDRDDNLWHERHVFSERLPGGTHIVCIPTWDIYEEDLEDNLGIETLGERGGAPRGLRGKTFRFEPRELAARRVALLVVLG